VNETTNSLLLGVDVGTSGSKGILTDLRGKILSSHSVEYNAIYPGPNRAEQDPMQWWTGFGKITRALLRKSRINTDDIVAVSVSGTYSDMCAVDRHGKTVRNAILYSDMRATEETNLVAAKVGKDRIREISGRNLNPTMVLPRILWYKKNEPQNFQRTHKILQSHGYIIRQLTNEYSVDYPTACPYATFDMNALEWCKDICDEFSLPIDLFPPAFRATDVVGEVTTDAAKFTHIRKGTPVIAGSGDDLLAMVGAGVTNPGDAIVTYGTSCVLNAVCEKRENVPEFDSGIHCVEPRMYIVGNELNTSGSVLRWFKDEFAQRESEVEAASGKSAYARLDRAAANIALGSDGLVVLPYFLGRYTGSDPRARGVVFGLTLSHTKNHVYRALLESTGYEIAEWLETLRQINTMPNRPSRFVATGGGARSRLWMQIVSDITNVSQQLIQGDAPYGNAYLAGYSVGVFKNFETLSDEWLQDGEIIVPSAREHASYQRYRQIYKRLYADLKEVFQES